DRICFIYKLETKKELHAQLEACRRNGETVAAWLNKQKYAVAIIADESGTAGAALAFAEGMVLGNYQFIKYKQNGTKDRNTLAEIKIKSRHVDPVAIKNLSVVCDAVYEARDLVNEPQNYLSATKLASAFVKLGRNGG